MVISEIYSKVGCIMSLVKNSKSKTKKTALYVLLIYMACQLSSFVLLVFPSLKEYLFSLIDAPTREEQALVLSGYWTTGAFALATLLILLVISRDKGFWDIFKGPKREVTEIIGWGILGFFMIYVGQILAVQIEMYLFGIEPGSDNTAQLSEMMKSAPVMIISAAIFAPILEEIIFRRVIFGSLIQKYNFWISAIISGVVFAAIHLEFEHLLLYTVCGLIFAFLYYKTKSIWTSIIAHMLLNSSVSLIQWYYEDIMDWLERNGAQLMIFFQ